MYLKEPLNYEQQIEKLIENKIQILDREKAKNILSEINYYKLTGYALQFRKNINKSECKEDTTLKIIYKIYKFDEDLRAVFRKYIEIAEVYYKTQIAYGFSTEKCIESPYNQHYEENNFYNKKGYWEVMQTFNKEESYYKDSLIVKHHKHKYKGKMPLWVMVELMTFSNVSKLYCSMFISEKAKIADEVGVNYKTLENHLHCLSVLRNRCAHTARLYNTKFNPPARFTKQFLRKNPQISNNSLFAYSLVLLRRLPNLETKQLMVNDLYNVFDKNIEYIDLKLIGFPKNYKEVLKNNIK